MSTVNGKKDGDGHQGLLEVHSFSCLINLLFNQIILSKVIMQYNFLTLLTDQSCFCALHINVIDDLCNVTFAFACILFDFSCDYIVA